MRKPLGGRGLTGPNCICPYLSSLTLSLLDLPQFTVPFIILLCLSDNSIHQEKLGEPLGGKGLMTHFREKYNEFTNCKIIKGNYNYIPYIHINISLLLYVKLLSVIV